MPDPIKVSIETTRPKTFASAMDWPGWSRAGKTQDLALEALAAYAVRYRAVVERAGLKLPAGGIEYDVVETVTGGSGTEFGVPSAVTELDRRPVSASEAKRIVALVEAAWKTFDDVAAGAPAELRKGPRGGGRDRDKMVDHVHGSDHAYAREMGIRVPPPDAADPDSVTTMRRAMTDVLGMPSDGSPLADRRWTARYVARRIAWHALDHAWEMTDRSERGP